VWQLQQASARKYLPPHVTAGASDEGSTMSHASPGILSAVQRSFVPRAVLRHKMLTILIVAAGVGAMCLLTAGYAGSDQVAAHSG
jgi:hypothetical protein